MIATNSALYLGILTACILERCPDALVHTEKKPGGYQVSGTRKVGQGQDARSVVSHHAFLDAETSNVSSSDLTTAARVAGDGLGAQLASAK